MFTKESLEKLREKIDLFDVLSSHMDLKRAGAVYKGLCPFHEEKTPSFTMQRSDRHYHCYGCGAHGDAIQFLMNYLNLSFADAVESLAERFQVSLVEEEKVEKGVPKAELKDICQTASRFFHAYLLYSEEGKEALTYLYKRSLTIDFIRKFEVGFAPEDSLLFCKVMRELKYSDERLKEAGLLNSAGRAFFRERICFPIRNHFGHVIGFSARKIKESTFGGKYINTPETPIFKKSKILFGFNFSRKRMAKERRAILVEGQIDCLKLIEQGLNLTVASLGTALGESHVDELEKLGIRCVYVLFDGDTAGQQAASKVGDLLQKRGMEVKVVSLPQGKDPDDFLSEYGMDSLIQELERAHDYLSFQVSFLSQKLDLNVPATKAELAKQVKEQIQKWQEPVMVHESLKRLAALIHIPEETIGATSFKSYYLKSHESLSMSSIDPNKILELDLLRWLILVGCEKDDFVWTAKQYLKESHFLVPSCRKLFLNFMNAKEKDLLSIAQDLEDPSLIDEILNKKVKKERAPEQFVETIQKLLDRSWMQEREQIKMMIHTGEKSEEEILALAKKFDDLKNKRIKVQWIASNM